MALLAFAACTPNHYRADVGAMFARGDGVIALQNAGGSLVLANEQNDLDRNMGLGDTDAAPYVRLEWERDRHRVRVHGFGFNTSGTGTLTNDFGGIVGGSAVETSLQFFSTCASYAYEVFSGQDFRIGLGGELGYYKMDVSANAGAARESVETDVLVPMPYAEAEYYLGDFTISANIGLMSADLSDANGRYLDTEAVLRWQPREDFSLLAGYRYFVLDAFGRASTRDFDADIDFDGFFVGGGVRF